MIIGGVENVNEMASPDKRRNLPENLIRLKDDVIKLKNETEESRRRFNLFKEER